MDMQTTVGAVFIFLQTLVEESGEPGVRPVPGDSAIVVRILVLDVDGISGLKLHHDGAGPRVVSVREVRERHALTDVVHHDVQVGGRSGFGGPDEEQVEEVQTMNWG